MKKFRIKPDFVLELSSSAVKKITRTSKEISRTRTKSLVDSRGRLDTERYRTEIIPVIKELWDYNKNGICIATALYRTITNSQEIIDLIRSETGIPVEVISGDTEAELIGKAIMSEYPGRQLLVIDAGSMSTEICIWPGGYRKSYKNGSPLRLDKQVAHDLASEPDLLIVVTGETIYKMGGPIENPRVKLRWHTQLQSILNQIGSHSVIGTKSTPGSGLLS